MTQMCQPIPLRHPIFLSFDTHHFAVSLALLSSVGSLIQTLQTLASTASLGKVSLTESGLCVPSLCFYSQQEGGTYCLLEREGREEEKEEGTLGWVF